VQWKSAGTKTLTLTVVKRTPSPPTQPPEEKSNAAMLLLGAAIGLALLSRGGEER